MLHPFEFTNCSQVQLKRKIKLPPQTVRSEVHISYYDTMSTTTTIPIEGASGNVDLLEVTPLGAGSEVGRSCIMMKFKGKTLMLDCGIHPAYTGLAALPFFDFIDDPRAIDLLLVSQ